VPALLIPAVQDLIPHEAWALGLVGDFRLEKVPQACEAEADRNSILLMTMVVRCSQLGGSRYILDQPC